jgi:3-deoxy-D-manno-octulosonic-acid transferase
VLAAEAAGRGVRLGLVSGTVSRGSSRQRGLARALLAGSYGRLDAVGAVSAEDARRLVSLGASAGAVHVTGDTRYDQVWARAQRVDRTAGIVHALASDRPTLVAGSTWPSDERVLLEAWRAVRREVPAARLIIAPHEPTASHLAPVRDWAAAVGLSLEPLDAPGAAGADVVLVDRVGVLGDLYALATAAYVGGGFHGAGLHSVLEPAAFGAPVLFGPRFANSRDAQLLLDADGGVSGRDVAELARTLTLWLGSRESSRAAGAKARAVVEQGLGAAERNFGLVVGLLGAGMGNG